MTPQRQAQLLALRFDSREKALQANDGKDSINLPTCVATLELLGGSWGFVQWRE